MRITEKQIRQQLNELLAKAGIPATREAAIAAGTDKYVTFENAPVYGGYRLISVGVENGGHYGAFGMSSTMGRMKAGEFCTLLTGIYQGLEFSKNKAA